MLSGACISLLSQYKNYLPDKQRQHSYAHNCLFRRHSRPWRIVCLCGTIHCAGFIMEFAHETLTLAHIVFNPVRPSDHQRGISGRFFSFYGHLSGGGGVHPCGHFRQRHLVQFSDPAQFFTQQLLKVPFLLGHFQNIRILCRRYALFRYFFTLLSAKRLINGR